MLKILSYNIQYGINLDQITEWIKVLKIKPDIICFQEFPEHKLSDLNLAGYNHMYISGWGRDGKIFGQVTLYKKDLELISSGSIDLGLRKAEQLFLRMSGQRNALLTTFKNSRGKITISNVHLPWLGLNSIRRNRLELIIRQLDKTTPSLIVGDFNYSSLFNRKGLVSFMQAKGFQLAGEYMVTHKLYLLSQKLKVLPQQLDYAFFRGLKIKDIKMLKVNYSDHYPIFLRINT